MTSKKQFENAKQTAQIYGQMMYNKLLFELGGQTINAIRCEQSVQDTLELLKREISVAFKLKEQENQKLTSTD